MRSAAWAQLDWHWGWCFIFKKFGGREVEKFRGYELERLELETT
jgi:hypothetical protein